MNKDRRKQIDDVINGLQELQGTVESIMNDEEEYRDNIPENLQGSERYEKAEEACDYLQEAYDGIDDVISSLEEAKG